MHHEDDNGADVQHSRLLRIALRLVGRRSAKISGRVLHGEQVPRLREKDVEPSYNSVQQLLEITSSRSSFPM